MNNTSNIEKHKVLVVDDRERILDLFDSILADEGFEVVARKSLDEGLEYVQSNDPVSLVLCGHCEQKSLDGLKFLRRVFLHSPNTTRFLCTCCMGGGDLEEAKREGNIHLYSKLPFKVDELKDQIRLGIKLYESNIRHYSFRVITPTGKLKILLYDKEKKIRDAVEHLISKNSDLSLEITKVKTEKELIERNIENQPDLIIAGCETNDCQNCFLYATKKNEMHFQNNLIILGKKEFVPCSGCSISKEEREGMYDFFFDKSTEFHKIGEIFRGSEK